jgi:hypothetical protein
MIHLSDLRVGSLLATLAGTGPVWCRAKDVTEQISESGLARVACIACLCAFRDFHGARVDAAEERITDLRIHEYERNLDKSS